MNVILIIKYIIKVDQISITRLLFVKLSRVYTETNNGKENQH